MKFYRLSHLDDGALRQGLRAAFGDESTATAKLIAYIAEYDARQLYREDGYPSMHSYCVGEFKLSDDAACRRIHAARVARQFPAIFEALAKGLLNLTAVNLLAPWLTPASADELLQIAFGRNTRDIERLLADRFPRSELLPLVEVLAGPREQLTPARDPVNPMSCQPAAPRVYLTNSKVTPTAQQRYALHLTMSEQLNQKLRHAQDLLGHKIPSGDIPQVLELALDALIRIFEKRKFGATENPRPPRPGSATGGRYDAAHVRRALRERDADHCTFVSDGGHRCPARKLLEFDHIVEVARGGTSTVSNLRLRCRTHNQYQAERTFGPDLMRRRKEERRSAAASQAQAVVAQRARQEQEKAAAERVRIDEQTKDIIQGLRGLGFRAEESRRAAQLSETMANASLEEQMRVALSCFHRGATPAGSGLASGVGAGGRCGTGAV
jgi:hypothetical protein